MVAAHPQRLIPTPPTPKKNYMKTIAFILIIVVAVVIVVYFALRSPNGRDGVNDLKKDIKGFSHDAGQTLKNGVDNAVDATKDGARDVRDAVK